VGTINRDGSYTAVAGKVTLTGKVGIVGGVLRGKGNETGNTGTYSLHRDGQNEVLIYRSDDGAVIAELRPVTKPH
jgi:hypothetical protein